MRPHLLTIALFLGIHSLNSQTPSTPPFRGHLLDPRELCAAQLNQAKTDGINTIVLKLQTQTLPSLPQALALLQSHTFQLYYWIEIARDPELADRHPLWMASIQGHPEWRRFFPNLPAETDQQIVKVYPWVPLHYKESFESHIAKVQRLLTAAPPAKGVFLNGLQGAPSACGCGHPLCRWTTDYGPKKTATPLDNEAPAQFLKRLQVNHPKLHLIPIWATECEQHDKPGLCAEVGCYNGACWREWNRQLQPLLNHSNHSPTIGALLLTETFQRPAEPFTLESNWIRTAMNDFTLQPQRYKSPGIPPGNLIAILENWAPSHTQTLPTALQTLTQIKGQGYLLAKTPIPQDWSPRLIPLP